MAHDTGATAAPARRQRGGRARRPHGCAARARRAGLAHRRHQSLCTALPAAASRTGPPRAATNVPRRPRPPPSRIRRSCGGVGRLMRRSIRILGTILIVAGTLTLVWALVVWQWQDPFTALYTKWRQHQLASQYEKRVQAFSAPISHASPAAERRSIAREAKRYRLASRPGEAIGRIVVPRMGVNMILVNGTDHDTLKKGPGRDPRTFMPGENRLVYIAGHRTTYLAPFSHIDSLRPGDRVILEVPYGTFIY